MATHGRFERSTVADYVIMFIVLLSNCIRIRHHARSTIVEGEDRVAKGCSWRLKRCGQAVELVVIGYGSILDWLICGCGVYLSSVCVSLVGSLVRALYAYVSFVCVLL